MTRRPHTGHPVLWHFPISHFNEKVRWALDYKRIPHVRRALFLDYLPKALWKTGQPTLPILIRENGTAIADSTRIIAELERTHPEPRLYPADPTQRQRALALEDFFDEELGHPLRAVVVGGFMQSEPAAAISLLAWGIPDAPVRFVQAIFPLFRLFYFARHKISRDTMAKGRTQVAAALDRIETELQPSGFLVGDGFSVADLTAAALFWPVVFPPEERSPAWLQEYRDSLSRHSGFQWVAEIYRRHRGESAEVTP